MDRNIRQRDNTTFGRDHNAKAMNLVFAGGDVRGGRYVGATDYRTEPACERGANDEAGAGGKGGRADGHRCPAWRGARSMRRVLAILCVLPISAVSAQGIPAQIEQSCIDCHDKESAKSGLDFTALPFDLNDHATRERWIRIHDRVEKGEMPPKAGDLPPAQRAELVKSLATSIYNTDHAEVLAHGRGSLRRLNRDEYEQNLRDVLALAPLDIRDMLPEDREGHHFNRTTEVLDMSRVQLAAYLDAADAALHEAMASGAAPPPVTKFRAVGTSLFPGNSTFGEREAMFFAKDGKAVDVKQLDALRDDPALELALFRSASWPYYGYPRGFIAKLPGEYRVRFSARAVVQGKGYAITAAPQPVPMTFRARKPSGPDVSGDVRATGGIMDIQPEAGTHETTVRLRAGETFEYSLLGLPVPLARNVKGGPPTYRYPPFPEGGQPGVAFQWLEVEGPLAPPIWPPPSHRVLFDDLGIATESAQPEADARRLLRRFVNLAARQPVPDDALEKYAQLILGRLEKKAPFAEAMLAGYKAFLCSGHFLYLPEPRGADDHFAIASRLSHFLANTRPDSRLMDLARAGRLRDAATLRAETSRLIADAGFERFVRNFTDYWLNLRHVRRDDPDMGGYGAARLGFKYPQLFGAVSILAGGPLDLDFAGPRAMGNPGERERILKGTFGGDLEFYRSQNPITVAQQQPDAVRGKVRVRMAVGARDNTGPLNRAYSEHLQKLNIAHTFTIVPGVGHDTLALLKSLGEENWQFYREAFSTLKPPTNP